MTKEQLFKHLLEETKVLPTDSLRKAFSVIDRKDFVPEEYQIEAYEDYPLPIGFEQTISQPSTVAFMLELLDVKEGNNILDVGSGSGWTTALLSVLVGTKGHVVGIERVPELVLYGHNNLEKYSFKNCEIIKSEKRVGKHGHKFDRILVSAEADKIPSELIEQLEPDGVLVIPVKGSIVKLQKNKNGKVSQKNFPGFMFVPLIKN